MFVINVTSNVKEIEKSLNELAYKQLPFATAMALNASANQAVEDLKTDMKRVFDRPTPWTLNAFYVKPATKNKPDAWVGIRDFAFKGTPAWKYLNPQFMGGTRNMKRFELRMTALSGGKFILPGRGMPLDGYGNISRGQITQILSRLNAMSDAAANVSNKTTMRLRKAKLTVAASGHRSEYFVAHSKEDGQPFAIYKLVGKGRVVPVMVFARKAPSYHPVFFFDKVVQKSIATHWNKHFGKAMAKAIATRKDK